MKMNALAILIWSISLGAVTAKFIYRDRHKTIPLTNKARCLKDLGLTEAQLKKEKQSSKPSFRAKCFFRCILERSKLISGEKIIHGAFKKIVGPKITCRALAQVESSCHVNIICREKIKDMCDFATIIYKCYSALIKQDLRLCKKVPCKKCTSPLPPPDFPEQQIIVCEFEIYPPSSRLRIK